MCSECGRAATTWVNVTTECGRRAVPVCSDAGQCACQLVGEESCRPAGKRDNAIRETEDPQKEKAAEVTTQEQVSLATDAYYAAAARMAVEKTLAVKISVNADVVLVPDKEFLGGKRLTARVYSGVRGPSGRLEAEPVPAAEAKEKRKGDRKLLWERLFRHLKDIKCYSEFYEGRSPGQRYRDALVGNEKLPAATMARLMQDMREEPLRLAAAAVLYGMADGVDRMHAAAVLGRPDALAASPCATLPAGAGLPADVATTVVSETAEAARGVYDRQRSAVAALADAASKAGLKRDVSQTADQHWKNFEASEDSCAYELLRPRLAAAGATSLSVRPDRISRSRWATLCADYGVQQDDDVALGRLLAVSAKKPIKVSGGRYVMTDAVARDLLEKYGAMSLKPKPVKGEHGLACRCMVEPPRKEEEAPGKEEEAVTPPAAPFVPAAVQPSAAPAAVPVPAKVPPPPAAPAAVPAAPITLSAPPEKAALSFAEQLQLEHTEQMNRCQERKRFEVPSSQQEMKKAKQFDQCEECTPGYSKWCSTAGLTYYLKAKKKEKPTDPEWEYYASTDPSAKPVEIKAQEQPPPPPRALSPKQQLEQEVVKRFKLARGKDASACGTEKPANCVY